MPIRVTFELSLRVDASAVDSAESSAELARKLAAKVQQLVATAAREVAADGHTGEARVHVPEVTWSGPGLAAVPDASRAVATARLTQAVLAAAQGALPAPRRSARPRAGDQVVIERAHKFRATPRRHFALLDWFRVAADGREDRYHDLLDQLADGAVFEVRTSGMLFLDEVRRQLEELLDRRAGARDYYYVLIWHAAGLRRVIALDPAALRGPLAGVRLTPPTPMQGMLYIGNARLAVVALFLPRLEQRTATVPATREFSTIKLRELAPIVDPATFLKATRATWTSYLHEWGDDEITVDLLPFTAHRATHGRSLHALYAAAVEGERRDRLQLGGLLLLTRNAVREFPSLPLDELSNPTTLALADTDVNGTWQPGWAGAYLSAWFDGLDSQIAAARHRPDARIAAAKIIALLKDPPHAVQFRIWDRVIEVYGRGEGWSLAERSEAFGYLLEQLDETAPRGVWLARFYAAAEAQGSLWELAVRLAHGTPYEHHPAVVRARDLRNERRRSARDHTYLPGQGMRVDGRWMLRPGAVLADGNSMYSVLKKQLRLKPSVMGKVGAWMLEAAKAVIRRCIDEQRELTKEEFAQAVLEEVQKQIGEDDVEEVEVQRSLRLLEVRGQDDRGIKRYFVTFNWVERVEGEQAWTDVQDERGRVIVREYEDGEIEELLFMWSYARSSVVVIAFSKGITYLALFVMAWEIGAFALVPHALGFMAVNVLLYLGKAAFFGGDFSIDGLALEAVKGYAMALGFQVFAPLGRFAGAWVAERIGAASIARVIAGYLLERIAAGVIMGAPTGALVQLATDLASIAMGRQQGFSDWRRYLASMGEGAVMGIFFEFGGDALRVFAKTTTAQALAAAIRNAGLTPAKWWAAIDLAQQNLRRWLVEVAGEVRALRFAELWEALVYEARGLKGLVFDEARAGIMHRILRFSDLKLTALGESGLQKLLAAIEPRLAEGLVRSLTRDAARGGRFLDALGALDENLVAILANRTQLEALLAAPRMLELIASRATTATRLFEAFTHRVAAIEAALVQLEQLPVAVRELGVQILARPGVAPLPLELVMRALRRPGAPLPDLAILLDRVVQARISPNQLDELLGLLERRSLAERLALGPADLRRMLIDAMRVRRPPVPPPRVTPPPPPTPTFQLKALRSEFVGEELGPFTWHGQPTTVQYLSAAERAAYKLTVRGGKLYDAAGNLFDTAAATTIGSRGRAIFVMDAQGTIYASTRQAMGVFHHSSFLAGNPVAGAGELVVEQGVLKHISGRSGHYVPPPALQDQVVSHLTSLGIDFTNVTRAAF